MKWRGLLLSFTLHGFAAALIVFFVRRQTEPPHYDYLEFADVPKEEPAPEPEPAPEKPQSQPEPEPAPKPKAESRRTPPREPPTPDRPPAPGAPRPALDFGLVLDNTEPAPAGAWTLPASDSSVQPTPAGTSSPSPLTPAEKASSSPAPCPSDPTAPVPRHRPSFATLGERYAAVGRLVLRLHVNTRGQVERVEVIRSVSQDLDRAASEAARSWTFAPATRCGKAVADTYTLAIRFEG